MRKGMWNGTKKYQFKTNNKDVHVKSDKIEKASHQNFKLLRVSQEIGSPPYHSRVHKIVSPH